ncbi:MAG: hypothetical protein O2794_00635 [bacterium]|nr:hypothetical protein [bacterium]
MKHHIYIVASIILWVLFTTLVHAGIELWILSYLVSDWERYSFGLSWGEWYLIHNVFATALLLLGIWGGYKMGERWWDIVYIQKRHWRKKNENRS